MTTDEVDEVSWCHGVTVSLVDAATVWSLISVCQHPTNDPSQSTTTHQTCLHFTKQGFERQMLLFIPVFHSKCGIHWIVSEIQSNVTKNKHFYTPILLNLLFIMWSVHWRLGQWCAIKIYILHNITELPYPQPPPQKKNHWRWFEGCAGWLTQWRFYDNFMGWYWRD